MSLNLFNNLIEEFTGLDLLNRALVLSDINEGNYGLVKDNNNRYAVKVVDFRIEGRNPELIENQKTFMQSFFVANGNMYKREGFIKTVLQNRTKAERITTAYNALNVFPDDIDKMIDESCQEVIDFALSTDIISQKQNAELMGLGKIDVHEQEENENIQNLNKYADKIKTNILTIKKYIADEYNKLLQSGIEQFEKDIKLKYYKK